VAVKVFSPAASDEMFYNEVKVMSTIRHPFCIQFMAFYHEDNERAIIMELMARGRCEWLHSVSKQIH